jgi:hypothetical protein
VRTLVSCVFGGLLGGGPRGRAGASWLCPPSGAGTAVPAMVWGQSGVGGWGCSWRLTAGLDDRAQPLVVGLEPGDMREAGSEPPSLIIRGEDVQGELAKASAADG